MDSPLPAMIGIFIVALIVFFIISHFVSLHVLSIGRHPDTNRIRCEDEQHNVYIGNVCFKKEAISWVSLDGKDKIKVIDPNFGEH